MLNRSMGRRRDTPDESDEPKKVIVNRVREDCIQLYTVYLNGSDQSHVRRDSLSALQSPISPSISSPSSRLRLFNMDNMRGPFSRLKKKLKQPLRGSTRKPEKMGSDVSGGRIGQTTSLPGPEPQVSVGGDEDRGGEGLGTDADEVLQRVESESVPAGENDGHQEDEKDVGQSQHLDPQPDAEPAAEIEETKQVHPFESATPTLYNEKTNSMWIWLFCLLPLIDLSILQKKHRGCARS